MTDSCVGSTVLLSWYSGGYVHLYRWLNYSELNKHTCKNECKLNWGSLNKTGGS